MKTQRDELSTLAGTDARLVREQVVTGVLDRIDTYLGICQNPGDLLASSR
jgi:hypothetical protein